VTDAALALEALRSYPTPVGIVGPDGTLRLCNRAWTAPGSPVGELSGRSLGVGDALLEVLAGSKSPTAREVGQLLRAVLAGERTAAEMLVAVAEAEAPGREAHHRVVVTAADLTEPGMAIVAFRPLGRGLPGEADLREREARLRQVTENVRDVFFLRSPDGLSLYYVSPTYESMFGRSESDLYRDPSDFLLAIHPHDRERVRSNLWRQAEGSWNEEFRVVRPDGTQIWLHSRAFPVCDEAGTVVRVAGITTDVTAQREVAVALLRQEERYRAIFESSPVGIAVVDLEGHILEANPALVDLLGWTHPIADDPVRSVLDFLGPEERKQGQESFLRLSRGDSSGWARETRLQRQDGSTVAVRIQVSPSHTHSDGGFAVLLVEDVSDRKRLEQQLRQAQRIESVGRLAGGIAHDFNNLVTVIQGHTDLLLDGMAQDDPLRPDLLDIRQAGERAAALTGQLLAFSRRNVLQPRVLDLNRIVESMEGILRRVLGEAVELSFEPAPDLGAVRADPAQMEQILLNLVMNSRDAMPVGGRLTIRTFERRLEQDFVDSHLGSTPGPHVAVEVTDTGHGMDVDTLALIFEPFFTTKDPGKGTGLGLAMAYGIVKQSGGYIDVESAPGQGATFVIYLPRLPDEVVEPVRKPAPASAGGRGSETILVVEDEPQVRALTARILASRGFNVLSAPTGRDAIATARAHVGPIHLLLTDVVMPGMGGSELAERIMEERPGTRVLFTSGYADDAVVRHGVFRRDTPFLSKPFTPAELADRVRRVLDVGD
jgi:PAS domain S-box-containing protein